MLFINVAKIMKKPLCCYVVNANCTYKWWNIYIYIYIYIYIIEYT